MDAIRVGLPIRPILIIKEGLKYTGVFKFIIRHVVGWLLTYAVCSYGLVLSSVINHIITLI